MPFLLRACGDGGFSSRRCRETGYGGPLEQSKSSVGALPSSSFFFVVLVVAGGTGRRKENGSWSDEQRSEEARNVARCRQPSSAESGSCFHGNLPFPCHHSNCIDGGEQAPWEACFRCHSCCCRGGIASTALDFLCQELWLLPFPPLMFVAIHSPEKKELPPCFKRKAFLLSPPVSPPPRSRSPLREKALIFFSELGKRRCCKRA